MAVFLTGSTGYLGAHVASNLLADSTEQLNLLVRAKPSAKPKRVCGARCSCTWTSRAFTPLLKSRVNIFRGDLTDAEFGLAERRLPPDDRHDRFGHPLRRIA